MDLLSGQFSARLDQHSERTVTKIQSWLDNQEEHWKASGALKTKYPTRPLFDAFLKEQIDAALARKEQKKLLDPSGNGADNDPAQEWDSNSPPPNLRITTDPFPGSEEELGSPQRQSDSKQERKSSRLLSPSSRQSKQDSASQQLGRQSPTAYDADESAIDSGYLRVVVFTAVASALGSLTPVLESLNHELVGVVTKPVSSLAKANGKDYIDVITATTKLSGKVSVFVEASDSPGATVAVVKALRPDLIICCGCNDTLSDELLALPRLGCVNLHDSLLPKYKGPNASRCALRMGETEIGLTIHRMTAEQLGGNILVTRKVHLGVNETWMDLWHKYVAAMEEMWIEAFAKILGGEEGVPQVPKTSNARKVYPLGAPYFLRSASTITWSRPALDVHNHIRSLSGPFRATAKVADPSNANTREIEVVSSEFLHSDAADYQALSLPGTIVDKGKNFMVVQCNDRVLRITKWSVVTSSIGQEKSEELSAAVVEVKQARPVSNRPASKKPLPSIISTDSKANSSQKKSSILKRLGVKMAYNKLGRTGLKVSAFSLGTWINFGLDDSRPVQQEEAYDIITTAYAAGINCFDTAEAYASGQAEEILGAVLKRTQWRRSSYIVCTKIFWGGKGASQSGLTRKHIFEGMNESLARLQLSYVDVFICHRSDPNTPLEETCKAIHDVIMTGKAFYWGTAEWPATDIASAIRICTKHGWTLPCVEQPQHSLLARKRLTKEYAMGPTNIGHNCMAWSALASGVLTCKYNSQVPSGSRFDVEQHTNVDFYWRRKLQGPDSKALVGELQRLARLALVVDCTPAQLALAWALSQHNVSTVILGVTTQGQLLENLQALKIANMMTPQVKTQLDQLFATLAD